MTTAAAILLAAWSAGPVVLRGSASADPREVVRIDIRGVEVRDEGGATLIGWERVKAVTGADGEAAAEFMALADDAWRAEARLVRGDFALAEALLERMASRLAGVTSSTALLAHGGLARVRLAQGDAEGAVGPWLRAFAVHAAGVRLSAEAGGVIGMDEETGLMPDLPPMFVRSPAVEALLDDWPPVSGSAEAEAISGWYRVGALTAGSSRDEVEIGVRERGGLTGASEHSVVGFVASIVSAFAAEDAGERARQREALRAMLPVVEGTWREAWARLALGRSLLREEDAGARDLGVLELLHVPARFGGALPSLAATALGDALEELRRRGDEASASIIERRLKELDPWHPAVGRRGRAAAPAVEGDRVAP